MAIGSQRLLLFDDNVRAVGGHFLELASLLVDGGHQFGYTTKLATHRSFDDWDDLPEKIDLHPAFRSRRLIHWSLGVDGRSRVRRDLEGKTVGTELLPRLWHMVRDPFSRRDRQPAVMLRRWADDFQQLVHQWQPGPDDRLVINTGDDFLMLALARALKQVSVDHPLNIDVIFHFAIWDQGKTRIDPASVPLRAKKLGRQVNDAIDQATPHRISISATTAALSKQLAAVGVSANPIPYPTRRRKVIDQARSDSRPLKLLMAGVPRAEKGRDQMPILLSSIWELYLLAGKYQLSMQMPARRWQRMIPQAMRQTYLQVVEGNSVDGAPFEILPPDLSSDQYHNWLDTADVGLFLYDSDRYVARCSGVLLEMLVRGIPVIVPANCWPAEQVASAGGNGSVGWIYDSIDEIPMLLEKTINDYTAIRQRASDYARVIADRHSPESTLRQMKIYPSQDSPSVTVARAA